MRGPPVVLTNTLGRPVTNVISERGAVPMTVVNTLGEPVTLVNSGGEPVTLLNPNGTLWDYPFSLFANNEQGAWYDPSDFSTLYQNSTGTTPVTAVEQPVGLMLDRSRGLVLGPELVTNGDFTTDSDWTKGTGWTISAGVATITAASGTPVIEQSVGALNGASYQVTFTMSGRSAGDVIVRLGGGSNLETISANGTYTRIYRSDGTGNLRFIATTGSTYSLDNISVRELPGNHATQATSTSRPVLRARYNLLTFSEQFDNAGWAIDATLAFGSGSTVNAAVAPDGTTTADLIVPDTSNVPTHRIRQAAVTSITAHAMSVYVKASGYSKVGFREGNITGAYATFNLSGEGSVIESGAGGTGAITALSNGWYRITVSFTAGATARLDIHPLNAGYASGPPTGYTYAGDGTSGLFLWGAQLLTSADQTATGGAYQRIAAATDYDTSNPVFRPYLAFDGVDDFMSLASAISITTNMTVVRAFKRASAGIKNAGLAQVSAANGDALWFSTNTVFLGLRATYTASAYSSTATGSFVSTARRNGSTETVRFNGTQVATAASAAASGSLGQLGLADSHYNNGPIYGLIVLNRELTGSELTATEQWMAGKTGVPSLQLLYDATDYLNGIAPYHWFDFVNDRALYASTDVGTVSGATGYSFSRASAGYYTNADGTLTSFASGELRRGDRGVLIEGARTNTFLQSQTIDNASWTKTGGSASANSVAAPDGTTTADLFTENSATSEHFVRQSVTLAAGYTVTFSAFVKFNGRRYVALRVSDVAAHAAEAVFDLTGGVVGVTGVTVGTPTVVGSSLTALANGWFRISFTLTMPGGSTSSARCDLCHVSSNATGSTSFTGDGASGTYIWGAQLEAASFPSSYIPTTTASATRAADVLTCTAGVTAPCALFAEFESYSDTSASIAAGLGRGTADNEWTARIRRNGTAIQGGTSTTSDTGSTSVTIGSGALTRKAAYRAAENDFALSVAGGTVSTDVSGVMPAAPTQLVIGSGSGIAYFLFGYVTRVAVFNSALSNANLQTVTT